MTGEMPAQRGVTRSRLGQRTAAARVFTMNTAFHNSALIAAILAAAMVAGKATQQEPGETESFSFKASQDWEYVLPAEVWTDIRGGIPIAHGNEEGFLVNNEPYTLTVDSDGNNKPDEEVKGVRGFVLLRGERADGSKFKYAVRIRNEADKWQYACGGAMEGKLRGTPVTLIDQNNNGRWNDYGEDAIIVGKSDAACLLSRVVNLSGALYALEVAETGETATTQAYAGDCGVLDLASGFGTDGELLAAVVVSTDQQHSFELAEARHGLLVPAGRYELLFASGRKGAETVKGRAGRMKALHVEPGATKVVQWGAPVQLEFSWSPTGPGEIQVEIPQFFGAAGEEWYEFKPDAKSPKIFVKDAKGKELWSGQFGGC